MDTDRQHKQYVGIMVTSEGKPIAAMIAYEVYLLICGQLVDLIGAHDYPLDTTAFDAMRADMIAWLEGAS